MDILGWRSLDLSQLRVVKFTFVISKGMLTLDAFLNPLVERTPALEELCVKMQQKDTRFHAIDTVVGSTTEELTSLRKLTLSCVSLVEDRFALLLQRNTQLREVTLENASVENRRWPVIFQSMRQHATLNQFHFDRLSPGGDIFRRHNLRFDRRNWDKDIERQLLAYLTTDGPWTDVLATFWG